ncbi:peptidoglycan recognition protein [Streptomyces sp. NPDC048309]|uniref:peptidoglycan recognition protein family protein n=1 Tax=Streptomyces sp. NPDC048309 TaxID=3154618 RepID=UPI0033E97178
MPGPVKTSRTGTMVPSGGTAHIADGTEGGEGGAMRVFRKTRGAPKQGAGSRRRAARPRLPRAVVAVLGCVPGLVAVMALVLCAVGVDRAMDRAKGRPGRSPVAALPAAAGRQAARPPIVPRSRWLDAKSTRAQPPPRYDDRVVAIFVHHTDSPNAYECDDSPRVIRHLYAGQTGTKEWDDIGYNFLVDRCGTIYEGRAGGVDRPVTGAHAQGFNHRTAGVAAIGTFTAGTTVPRAMSEAIAALAAWKLGLSGVDPRGTVRLVSSNDLSRYRAGAAAELPTVVGHDVAFMTSCPGAALTARLPDIRSRAARLQGR